MDLTYLRVACAYRTCSMFPGGLSLWCSCRWCFRENSPTCSVLSGVSRWTSNAGLMWQRRKRAARVHGYHAVEILPNVRGPLIVDFCLPHGYTTILWDLGFLGLGLRQRAPIGDPRSMRTQAVVDLPHPARRQRSAFDEASCGSEPAADGLRERALRLIWFGPGCG